MICAALALLWPIAGTAGPPPAIARYHVTVTIQQQVDIGTGRVSRTVARDVRTASGTVIGPDGLVVTAAHVARTPRRQAIIEAFDGSTYRARVLAVAPGRELAALKIQGPWDFDLPSAPVNGHPAAGETATAVGLVSRGSVAVRAGEVRAPRLEGPFRFGAFGFRNPMVLAMPVTAGFSGGPVFDARDRWLGIIVGYQVERRNGEITNTGETYALPARRILDWLQTLR